MPWYQRIESRTEMRGPRLMSLSAAFPSPVSISQWWRCQWVSVHMCECVCVCVCVWERGRERERYIDRDERGGGARVEQYSTSDDFRARYNIITSTVNITVQYGVISFQYSAHLIPTMYFQGVGFISAYIKHQVVTFNCKRERRWDKTNYLYGFQVIFYLSCAMGPG